MDSLLFDSISTLFYVIVKYVLGLDLGCEYLEASMHSSMLVRVLVCSY